MSFVESVRRQAVHPQPKSFKDFWETLPHGTKVLDESKRKHLQATLQAVPSVDGESVIIRAVWARSKYMPIWPYKVRKLSLQVDTNIISWSAQIMLLQYNNIGRKSSIERHEAYSIAVPKRLRDDAAGVLSSNK